MLGLADPEHIVYGDRSAA